MVRGYIVRKKFKKLREEYVELVMSLEENLNRWQVTWKLEEGPCFPSLSCGCSKGKTKCESMTDSVGKQDQGIATCFKSDVPVVNICQTTTQISNSGTTEVENCEFREDCATEKTLGIAQDMRDMPDDELLESSQTDKLGLDTVEDGENTVNDGERCSDFESCKSDVPELQEQIAATNDDSRLREESILHLENMEIKNTDFQELEMRGKQYGITLLAIILVLNTLQKLANKGLALKPGTKNCNAHVLIMLKEL